MLPLQTAALPGIGGILRTTDDDFHVEELPAYEPSGEGEHVFALIEKRGLTTPEAATALARAVGVPAGEVGWAGMKDKHAVAVQWLSFPRPATPEALQAAGVAGVRVLSAQRHGNKLRTGHLRGNRFRLVVRQLEVEAEEAARRARAIFAALAEPPGCPNWFGGQRFGSGGQNPDMGRAIVLGEGRRLPRGRARRMYISALQSQLFNEYLRRRIEDERYRTVLTGDLLQKRDSGGIFVSADPGTDQARLRAGEVVPTGPMFGHRMKSPPPDSDAAAREQAVLDAAGLRCADFQRVGKLGTGTRRAIAVDLGPVEVAAEGDAVSVSFQLPPGSYATAVMREVVKGADDFPR